MNIKENTPRSIIRQLVNYRISEDDAVAAIEKIIEAVKDELTGTMGATEYKCFIDMIKQDYRCCGYRIRGSMDDIKDILDQVIKECGFDSFEEIKNTKENRYKITTYWGMNWAHYLC